MLLDFQFLDIRGLPGCIAVTDTVHDQTWSCNVWPQASWPSEAQAKQPSFSLIKQTCPAILSTWTRNLSKGTVKVINREQVYFFWLGIMDVCKYIWCMLSVYSHQSQFSRRISPGQLMIQKDYLHLAIAQFGGNIISHGSFLASLSLRNLSARGLDLHEKLSSGKLICTRP